MKKHPKKKKDVEFNPEIELQKFNKFKSATTEYEKMEVFKSIISDDYKIVALRSLPENEREKYLQFIKSAEATIEVINEYSSDEKKREVFQRLTSKLKGNADKYLKLLSLATFKPEINPEIPIIKLNNLSALNVDMLSKIQRNVINYNTLKFKLNERIYDKIEYSFHEICAIIIKMEELTAGINPNASDLEKFSTIYERITDSITYDHECVRKSNRIKDKRDKEFKEGKYEDADKSQKELYDERRNAAGLYGGLVDGKSICSGYSIILHEALQYVGVKSKYIEGQPQIITGSSVAHAWNQVKIDGKWYNVDATWDAGNLQRFGNWRYALLDDKKFFKTHAPYSSIFLEHYPCTDSNNQLLVPEKHNVRKDRSER